MAVINTCAMGVRCAINIMIVSVRVRVRHCDGRICGWVGRGLCVQRSFNGGL